METPDGWCKGGKGCRGGPARGACVSARAGAGTAAGRTCASVCACGAVPAVDGERMAGTGIE